MTPATGCAFSARTRLSELSAALHSHPQNDRQRTLVGHNQVPGLRSTQRTGMYSVDCELLPLDAVTRKICTMEDESTTANKTDLIEAFSPVPAPSAGFKHAGGIQFASLPASQSVESGVRRGLFKRLTSVSARQTLTIATGRSVQAAKNDHSVTARRGNPATLWPYYWPVLAHQRNKIWPLRGDRLTICMVKTTLEILTIQDVLQRNLKGRWISPPEVLDKHAGLPVKNRRSQAVSRRSSIA